MVSVHFFLIFRNKKNMKNLSRLVVRPHTDAVYHACFSEDGQRIASCGADKTLQVNLSFEKNWVMYLILGVFFLFLFWPCHMTCGILVRQPRTEPGPWQWKCQVLTIRLPGNSCVHIRVYFNSETQENYTLGVEEHWDLLNILWKISL